MKFDIRKNLWSEEPSLNKPRNSHSSCVLNDRLYVFGGYRSKYLSSVEVFDIVKRNTWSLIELPNIEPRAMAIFCPVSETQIIIIGG